MITLETLKDLRSFEWRTKRGWLAYSFGIFLITGTIIITFNNTGVLLNSYWKYGIFIIPQIIHSSIWLSERFYFSNPNIPTVAFSISTESTSKNYYHEIKKRFRQHIIDFELKKYLKIKDLPSDITFSTPTEAERFISKKKIALLIWGNTYEGTLRDSAYSQFNISLSYIHKITDKVKQDRFVSVIGASIQRKQWGIWQPNSFNQLGVVSENIVETSLFTLGACLSTVRNIDYLLRSVDIFEKLNAQLQKRKEDKSFPNLFIVKQNVRSFLLNSYDILMSVYYRDKNLEKAIEYATKTIKLDENNFSAHQRMALYQWLNGNKILAEKHTKRASKIKPTDPMPKFNKAFFYFDEKNYKQALKQYKKIKAPGEVVILELVEFLENEHEKNPDNLGFLFAAAWINIRFADRESGIKELSNFTEKAKGKNEYELLLNESKNILSNQLPASHGDGK